MDPKEKQAKFPTVPPVITGPVSAMGVVPMSPEDMEDQQSRTTTITDRDDPPPYTPSATTASNGPHYSGTHYSGATAAAPVPSPVSAPFNQAPADNKPVKKAGTIKSTSSLDLQGPMEISGSVRAMGNIAFLGDFTVGEKIEGYGNIDVHGSLACKDKIKAYGNIKILGRANFDAKVKCFGKLKVVGTCESTDTIEVWGAATIKGFLKCKSLTVRGSITMIGADSGYEVLEKETVWGQKIMKKDDYED